MLIKSYIIQNTKIEIYDDIYQNKSKEEIRQIIKKIEKIGRKAKYKPIGSQIEKET